jgi:protein-arginine kinase activator protein McsA
MRIIFEKPLESLAEGETGYTVPWALTFGKDKNIYLSTNFTATQKPICASCMPIKRIGPGKADYEINLNFEYFMKKEYEWKEYNVNSHLLGYVKMDKENLINNTISKKTRDNISIRINSISNLTIQELKTKLETAIRKEEYELAAKLRDEIKNR